MSYTVGTKVTIRKDLEVKIYDAETEISAVSDMLKYRGKIATITRVDHDSTGTWYHLDIDGDNWNWTAGMFDTSAISIAPIAPIIPGTVVKCANGKKYYVHNRKRAFAETSIISLEKEALTGPWEIIAVYDVVGVMGFERMLSSIETRGKLIWEKEAKEMTIAEISKALGYEVKIIKEDF